MFYWVYLLVVVLNIRICTVRSLGVPSPLCLYTENNGFFWSKLQHNLVLFLFIQADDMFRPLFYAILRAQDMQGEHKVFPWLQTFITRKLRGIQT